VAAASPAVAAEISVDCDAGQSLAAALGQAIPGDTIHVRGTCRETVTIRSDGLTIDGGGEAALEAASSAEDVVTIPGARGITMKRLTVRNGREGILATDGATLVLEGVTVERNRSHGVEFLGALGDLRQVRSRENGRAGVIAARNSQLDLTDATLTENLTGLVLYSNATARLFGSAVANRNRTQGISVGLGASLFAIGASVEASHNGAEGVFMLQGGNVQQIGGALKAAQNDTDGILLQQGSRLLLGIEEFGVPGTAETSGNGRSGLRAIDASAITTSRIMPLASHDNARSGLHLEDGSSATIGGATIRGNGVADVRLLFGSRLTLNQTAVGVLVCDQTALVRGNTKTRCLHDRGPR
jgi:hypothetical protein